MYISSQIAKKYTEVGVGKTKYTKTKTFFLAVFAGIFIAFGAFGSQVVAVDAGGASIARLLSAAVFPIGLFMVVTTGAELFTGNNLMIISVLDKKITVKDLLRNWGIVYLGNFAGSIFVAVMLTYGHAFSLYDGKMAEAVVTTATNKVLLPLPDAIIKAVLCNILVCIAIWISCGAEELVGKVVGLYLPILMFVLSGFEHSVANMYFIPAGLLASVEYGIASDALTVSGFLLHNLLPVTIGNMIGGVCIVGTTFFFLYLHHGVEN